MVSPGALSIEPKKPRRLPHHRLAHQPVDLREGVAKAYSVVKEVGEAWAGQAGLASTLLQTAVRGGGCSRRAPGAELEMLPTAGQTWKGLVSLIGLVLERVLKIARAVFVFCCSFHLPPPRPLHGSKRGITHAPGSPQLGSVPVPTLVFTQVCLKSTSLRVTRSP